MRGLDPRICRQLEMAGSSPAMTRWVKLDQRLSPE